MHLKKLRDFKTQVGLLTNNFSVIRIFQNKSVIQKRSSNVQEQFLNNAFKIIENNGG